MKSMRRTLTCWLIGGFALLGAVGAAGLFLGVRTALTTQFDETLAARVATIAAATRWDGNRVELEFPVDGASTHPPGSDAGLFDLREVSTEGSAGRVLFNSPSLDNSDWPSLDRRAHGIFDAMLPDGRLGRVASIQFVPALDEEFEEEADDAHREAAIASTPTLVAVFATSRQSLDMTLRVLAVSLLAAGVITGLGVLGVVRMALRRGLEPLRRLETEVRSIGADSLALRFDPHQLPQELRGVYLRLNDLLLRLSAAFDRERRFSGAAAHELRTPLAELRTLLEVTLGRPRSADEARGSLQEALDISVHMDRLVTSLFTLSRCSRAAAATPIDLPPFLERHLIKHGPRASDRGLTLSASVPDSAMALADPQLLELVLDNIIANAVEYAAPDSTIECAVLQPTGANEWVEIRVTNTAAALTHEDVERFFEPFWRRSESRTERDHLGLGLTLARQAVEQMGGRITATLVAPTLVQVTMRVPAAPIEIERRPGEAVVIAPTPSHTGSSPQKRRGRVVVDPV